MKKTLFRIEPTNSCNQMCYACFRTDMKGNVGYMNPDLFKKAIDGLRSHHSFSFYWRGEPLLHPELEKLILIATRAGHFSYIVSNGLLLDRCRLGRLVDAGLKRIVFSLDTLDELEYKRLRGVGDIKTVLTNIENSIESHVCEIGLNCVEHGCNALQIAAIEDRFAGRVSFIRKLGLSKPIGSSLGEVRGCGADPAYAYVTWDGFVSPCCMDVNCQIFKGVNVFESGKNLAWLLQSTSYANWLKLYSESKLDDYMVCRACMH